MWCCSLSVSYLKNIWKVVVFRVFMAGAVKHYWTTFQLNINSSLLVVLPQLIFLLYFL